jgi:D-glycero-beta-D-manno-heptose-7-phosphate kinase
MSRTLPDILGAMDGKRILCLGDVMLDEYLVGNVQRISPEAPVPIVEIHSHTYVPGGAGNVAANVASLGGRAILGGAIGNDYQAGKLHEALLQKGVDAAGLRPGNSLLTTTKTRIIAHRQQIARVDHERRISLPEAIENDLLDWAAGQMTRVDACILSDYAKGVVSQRVAVQFMALARRAGVAVVVDPKGTDYAKYRGARVVKPNLHEAERVVKFEIANEADLNAAGQALLGILGGASLLITRGPQGMSLFQPGAEPVHISSTAREIFDVTGAGDTVVSALALALAAGATLEQAAQLANRAAGVAVAKVGTTAVTIQELREVLVR